MSKAIFLEISTEQIDVEFREGGNIRLRGCSGKYQEAWQQAKQAVTPGTGQPAETQQGGHPVTKYCVQKRSGIDRHENLKGLRKPSFTL
ncbi:hypothetical protein Y1Q_0019679 [Alligator mississippiensis]|uniref:Uncharacterized protein n=1 Tax=Alligator mississippiensis TaxID=8496 RepID=A0A151PEQ3_ALLMI|nr:hypothetical protein Y1Q_0019679 [Alligator mississippiensis]